MKLADLSLWKQACSSAWLRLSKGRDGFHVLRGESWACAIARVAGELLRREDFGRPLGPVPSSWERAATDLSRERPCSSDGLVSGPGGIRLSVETVDRLAWEREGAKRAAKGGAA